VIALESDMLEKIDWVCHWNFHFKKHEKKDVIHAKIMQPKLNRYDFWWFVLLCNILHNILYYMCHFLVYFASLVGLIFNFRTGTTGDATFTVCEKLYRVHFVGHTANRLFAVCLECSTRQIYRHTANRMFAVSQVFSTRQINGHTV